MLGSSEKIKNAREGKYKRMGRKTILEHLCANNLVNCIL
jgi:hypothetical protein